MCILFEIRRCIALLLYGITGLRTLFTFSEVYWLDPWAYTSSRSSSECICLDTHYMLLIIIPAGPAEDTDPCLCSATSHPRSTRQSWALWSTARGRSYLSVSPVPLEFLKASDCLWFMMTVIKRPETLMAPWTMDQAGSPLAQQMRCYGSFKLWQPQHWFYESYQDHF